MSSELQKEKQEVATAEGVERTRANRVYVPNVDIYTENDAVVLVADMPGVHEDSVDVTLDKEVLTIEGFVEPMEMEGYELAFAEYGVGDYLRRFTLPDEIDRDSIEATVSNGVVRITLPKAPEAKARKIEVKTV